MYSTHPSPRSDALRIYGLTLDETRLGGAIVQVRESGWSHDSTVTSILLDLKRAQSIFFIGR